MQVQVGSETFKTKKALGERVRAILYGASIGVELDAAEHSFLLALLGRHPNAAKKIGPGVRAFRVTASLYGNRCFEILRVDGTETDFSYLKCVTPKTTWSEFLHAMRRAIGDQIFDFKNDTFGWPETLVCPLSGATITRDQAHVDHVYPDTFEALVDAFVEEEKLDRDALPLGPTEDGLMGRRLVDPALEDKWRAFHKAHAKLRVISEEAHKHLKRPKEGPLF